MEQYDIWRFLGALTGGFLWVLLGYGIVTVLVKKLINRNYSKGIRVSFGTALIFLLSIIFGTASLLLLIAYVIDGVLVYQLLKYNKITLR